MIHTVLVVDDSPADLENIRSIVATTGCTVITATSGQEAVEKATTLHPDLIFMDVIMKNKDGFQACREIKSDVRSKGIPIVFVSGKCQKADRVWAELQGGKGLIGKPYSKDDIVQQIKTA